MLCGSRIEHEWNRKLFAYLSKTCHGFQRNLKLSQPHASLLLR